MTFDRETASRQALVRPLDIVFLGLSITSSWGNAHAAIYRGLVRELSRRGHRVLFLERDLPWYATRRDLARPPDGTTALYRSIEELRDRFAGDIAGADLVVIGSFVPDGCAVASWVLEIAAGVVAFYDIDPPVTLSRLVVTRSDGTGRQTGAAKEQRGDTVDGSEGSATGSRTSR